MTLFARTATPGQRWKDFLPTVTVINEHSALRSSSAFLFSCERRLEKVVPKPVRKGLAGVCTMKMSSKKSTSGRDALTRRRNAPLITPTDLGSEASSDIAGGMNGDLADGARPGNSEDHNFHWHTS